MHAVLLKQGQGIGHVGIGHVIAARAEGGSRCLLERGQHVGGQAGEVNQVAHEEAANPVAHAVHALDTLRPGLAQHTYQ